MLVGSCSRIIDLDVWYVRSARLMVEKLQTMPPLVATLPDTHGHVSARSVTGSNFRHKYIYTSFLAFTFFTIICSMKILKKKKLVNEILFR